MFVRIFFNYDDCHWYVEDTKFLTSSVYLDPMQAIIDIYEKQGKSALDPLYKYILTKFEGRKDLLDRYLQQHQKIKKYASCLKYKLAKDRFIGKLK